MLVPSFCGDRKDAKSLLHQDPNWITSWWILMDHESWSHFLEVVTVADYWTLSGRRQAYLEAGRSYVEVSDTSGQHCTALKMGLGGLRCITRLWHLTKGRLRHDVSLDGNSLTQRSRPLTPGGAKDCDAGQWWISKGPHGTPGGQEIVASRALAEGQHIFTIIHMHYSLIHLNLNPYVAGSECVCVCRSSS